jgi:hypothetical protein
MERCAACVNLDSVQILDRIAVTHVQLEHTIQLREEFVLTAQLVRSAHQIV